MTIAIEAVFTNDGEEIGFYSKGHHDPAAFRAACAEAMAEDGDFYYLDPELTPPPSEDDEVRHETWRDEITGDDEMVWFRPAQPGEPGAYPVTCYAFEGGVLAAPADPPPLRSPLAAPAMRDLYVRRLGAEQSDTYDAEVWERIEGTGDVLVASVRVADDAVRIASALDSDPVTYPEVEPAPLAAERAGTAEVATSPERAVQMEHAAARLAAMAQTVDDEIDEVTIGWCISTDKVREAADALREAAKRMRVDLRGCWLAAPAPAQRDGTTALETSDHEEAAR